MAKKREVYTICIKLQTVAVAAKTSKEAAAMHFIVDPCKVCCRLVTLTASDNFGIATIVQYMYYDTCTVGHVVIQFWSTLALKFFSIYTYMYKSYSEPTT